MPRFFFNVRDGRDNSDVDGTELFDLATARRAAVALTGQVLLDDSEGFWREEHVSVEVTDATGLVLFILHVDAVIAPALISGRAMLPGSLQ